MEIGPAQGVYRGTGCDWIVAARAGEARGPLLPARTLRRPGNYLEHIMNIRTRAITLDFLCSFEIAVIQSPVVFSGM